MRERRRKQSSESADDDASHSPGPSHPLKKRRVQRPTPSVTPVPDEDLENQPSAMNNQAEDLLDMVIPERPAPAMSTDPDAPRLIITKIDVENFKSYYGKQTLGPFHKNFTSILGPNGSGKSNVIDSLLFVFGFRANKVRSKKIAHLIHNSSAHPNVKSCVVTVHFAKIIDKGTTHEIQPGTEFNISRSATKSGSSTYYIDGRSSSPNDVRNTLKANGIDLDHNRFLILQGEVEQISLMKPKRNERTDEDGMLEYLEDIIGSSRLKEPIEKFKKQIDIFDNEQEMIQKRLKLAETEVSQLVEPVREVIRLMRVENAVTLCKHKLYSIDRLDFNDKSNDARQSLDQIRQLHTATEDQLRACNTEIKKQQRKKNRLIEEESSLKEKIDDAEKRKQDAELDQRKNADEISRIENRKTKKETEIKKERKKLEEAEAAPDKAEQFIRQHQESIEAYHTEITACEALIKELGVKERQANEVNRNELVEIMPQITSLSSEENKWESDISVTRDRLQRAQNVANDPQDQLNQAEERVTRLETELENSRRQHDNLSTQLPELAAEVKTNNETYHAQRHRETELQDQVSHLQREIESNKSDMNTNSSNNAALLGLMAEKQSNRIEGIYGRLGDLGGIDQHYDVAISTCCPQLEYVVVNSAETAQQCIGFLKDNNLSRMTFVALDKQESLWSQIKNKPKTPEDAPRLIDLIRVSDETVKPAFYSVLRDTLFAETIEDATRISTMEGRRWRVVTARGEVVEPSGTMTGGGRKEIKGRMGKRVRVDTSHTTNEQDWRKMEYEVKQLREELTELRRNLSTDMDRLKNQQEEYRKLEHQLKILNMNIPQLERQFDSARKEVEKARQIVQNTRIDESEINKLKSEIERYEKEKEGVCNRALSLRKEKDKLDARIKKIEDNILGESKDELKQLKDALKKAEDDCKKEKLTLKNSSTTIQRIRRNIDNAEQAIREAHDELMKANTNIAKFKADYELRLNQKVEYEQRLAETTAAIEESTTELTRLGTQESEFSHLLGEQQQNLRVAEGRMSTYLEKLSEVETEIGRLMLYSVRSDITLPEARPHNNTVVGDVEAAEGNQDGDHGDHSVLEVSNNEEQTNEAETNAETNDDMDAEANTAEEVTEEDGESNEEDGEPNADNDEEVPLDIDEQTEDLPNTTVLTTPDGDVTHNPVYDMGTLPEFTDEEIRALNRAHLRKQLEGHEKLKSKFKIKMNLSLLDDYAEKSTRRAEVKAEMDRLKEIVTKHRKKLLELTQRRNDEFNEGFQKICLATQEIYQMITLGGDAMLEKVNAMDTFTEGVTFQVRPPKKTWKQITNLSGGEKTLASLALVFGLHTYRPTPLYVMDEIDAALDYRNVSIISTYLKERTQNAQFIIISLRNNMFEQSDLLLGIYKVNDCTHNMIYVVEDNSDEEEQV